jgi:hypothetical protein
MSALSGNRTLRSVRRSLLLRGGTRSIQRKKLRKPRLSLWQWTWVQTIKDGETVRGCWEGVRKLPQSEYRLLYSPKYHQDSLERCKRIATISPSSYES